MTPLLTSAAEAVGLAAFGWIAEDAERAGQFLAATGAAASDLRSRAADPAFLGFVLDFVLQEDASVLAVAERAGCPPEDIARARAALPGGDLPHWT